MPDINREASEFWNSLKPMIDEEIKTQTRGMVQRRKMRVTTAPSLNTNKIGVTEPFGTEMLIPFTTNLISATVGDVVWVEFMYGLTNAFASMFASADEKDWDVAGDLSVVGNAGIGGNLGVSGATSLQNTTVNGVLDITPRRCYATLSSEGWYRVCKTADISGTIIDFSIGRPYGSSPAEAHRISFYVVGGGKSAFLNETSDSNTLLVDKIRCTYGGGFMYFDIHYTASSSNQVLVYFDVYGKGQENQSTVAEQLQDVVASPSGETVLTEYTFAANGNNAFKVISASGTTTSGAFTISEASVTVNSRVVATPQYFRNTTSVAWFIMLQPTDGGINVYVRDASGNIPANGTEIDLDILIDNR